MRPDPPGHPSSPGCLSDRAIFGFANARRVLCGHDASALAQPVRSASRLLFVGKQLGVFAFAWGAIGRARRCPAHATRRSFTVLRSFVGSASR